MNKDIVKIFKNFNGKIKKNSKTQTKKQKISKNLSKFLKNYLKKYINQKIQSKIKKLKFATIIKHFKRILLTLTSFMLTTS